MSNRDCVMAITHMITHIKFINVKQRKNAFFLFQEFVWTNIKALPCWIIGCTLCDLLTTISMTKKSTSFVMTYFCVAAEGSTWNVKSPSQSEWTHIYQDTCKAIFIKGLRMTNSTLPSEWLPFNILVEYGTVVRCASDTKWLTLSSLRNTTLARPHLK